MWIQTLALVARFAGALLLSFVLLEALSGLIDQLDPRRAQAGEGEAARRTSNTVASSLA